jgi:two-component system LytT family response regulator
MKLRFLIVDDEPLARSRVRGLAAQEPGLELVGEAGDGETALRLVAELRPDLLFLDIEMPPPNGLDVLRAARSVWLPCVIFTTAHARHAVEAFEAEALDYLLKPYSAERFAAAVARARERRAALGEAVANGDPLAAALEKRPAPLSRLLVKDGERYLVVRSEDIRWVESAANYVVIHTTEGNKVLRRTLGALERELDASKFFRSSRSTLVRLDEVKEIRQAEAGDHVIILRDGTRVPLTRGLRELQCRL